MASVTSEKSSNLITIVAASAAGTTFEWYDFFIFGSLTSIIAKNFYAGVSDTLGVILALLTFGVGFIFRPIGALVFGHIGDRKGRKGTFLGTILIMGIATVAIGFLPTYKSAGVIAPILLILLRIVQGFALGGEYGGAAIYVAEHAPADKRGAYTGWIQVSAAFGLLIALGIILLTRLGLSHGTTTEAGEAVFADWGWRIPFWVSSILLIISVYIRAKTAESPAFQALHAEQKLSKAPFRESFAHGRTLNKVLVALFGFMTAQGAIWYCSFFYVQVYLEKSVRLDPQTITYLVLGMTVISVFCYLFFAWLSDKVGRKPIMVGGMIIACLTFRPGFEKMMEFGNPTLYQAMKTTPVLIVADPATCSLQFDPAGTAIFSSPCDVAKSVATAQGLPYKSVVMNGGSAEIRIGATTIKIPSAQGLGQSTYKALKAKLSTEIKTGLKAAGYPAKADLKSANLTGLFAILAILSIACSMLYAPMAAQLVEMFPTKVRYTALSLPYNIGTGWFGGLMPAISFAMVAASGDIYFGLWYPVVIGVVAILVSVFFLTDNSGAVLEDIEH